MSTSQAHYVPKRGIQITKADYVILQSTETEENLPRDYDRLAGSKVAVPHSWLMAFLGKVKDKSKPFTIKKLMDGLFEPEDLAGKNSSSFTNTEKAPLVEAIQLFGLSTLCMKGPEITAAFNLDVELARDR
ncbi:uncharacterized protein [Ptychodera flava]|uniref:uncharacterized protein n=1 Tax=Ptychodera flava TaxID=63121 RepID=UPI00396AA46A